MLSEAARFSGLAPGERLWLVGQGTSLWPLVLPGDALLCERCAEETLALGEVALRPKGEALVAHLVVGLAPLVTASSTGALDIGLGPALGRVVTLKRGPWLVPVSRLTPLLAGWSRAASVTRRLELARRLKRALWPR